MSEIIEELTVSATPEAVYNAITLQSGIMAWWSNHVKAEPVVGSVTMVSFENGNTFKLKVINLANGKRVHWLVESSPHDWEGSTITWDVTSHPTTDTTKLVFGHHNLTVGPTGYTIEETHDGWRYFLVSLKSYLDTGKGTPFVF